MSEKPHDKEVTQIECSDCGGVFRASLRNDGEVPGPCPDCGSQSVEVGDAE